MVKSMQKVSNGHLRTLDRILDEELEKPLFKGNRRGGESLDDIAKPLRPAEASSRTGPAHYDCALLAASCCIA